MTQPTVEQSTTTRVHAHKWLTDSGLDSIRATGLLSAAQHDPGHVKAIGAHKVLFTLAHTTPHGFQQNTWTITRPL